MHSYVYNYIALFLNVELRFVVMLTGWWSVLFFGVRTVTKHYIWVVSFFLRCFVLVIYVFFFVVATLFMGIDIIQGLIGAVAVAGLSFCVYVC